MDLTTFIGILILGVLLCVCLSYLAFIDYLTILLKIIPLKAPKGYNEYKKLMVNDKYKKHKIKWRRIYLLNSPVYAIVYIVSAELTQSILKGFLIGLIVIVLGFGISGNLESKQKRQLKKKLTI